ncbi:MAG: hypothetical protein ACI3YK_04995 [Eubacteriales bacterium]
MMIEYRVDSKELSYSCSNPCDFDKDTVLFDNILADWFSAFGKESEFDADQPGKVTDVGYRASDLPLQNIIPT